MKNNNQNHHNKKYKSVMDDPHYDPVDISHFVEPRNKNGEMSDQNRQAMYKVLFSEFFRNHTIRPNSNNPSSLLQVNLEFDDEDADKQTNSTYSSSSVSSNFVNQLRNAVEEANNLIQPRTRFVNKLREKVNQAAIIGDIKHIDDGSENF